VAIQEAVIFRNTPNGSLRWIRILIGNPTPAGIARSPDKDDAAGCRRPARIESLV